jgi:hypothetical protein
MLLQALACHPEGLTTPQLAKAIGEPARPWQRALKLCGTGMRLHERLGRAERAGTAPAKRGRAVAWRITPAGAAWLASRALTALRNAQNAQEAEAYAGDLRVAADRMVEFHRCRARPAARLPAAR